MAGCDAHAAGGLHANTPLAKDATPPCGLCGQALSAPTVTTFAGERVHVACAERAARQAWRERQLLAGAHALIIVSSGAALLWLGVATLLLIAVLLAWGALHSRLHARFWHYAGRDVRRWLRGAK